MKALGYEGTIHDRAHDDKKHFHIHIHAQHGHMETLERNTYRDWFTSMRSTLP